MEELGKTKREMMDQIQSMREKMINVAEEFGMNSVETIECSQELDKLIYEYQCFHPGEQNGGETKTVMKQMILIWPKSFIYA